MWYDNLFKFWLANAISNNSKLFYFQHGCNYGTTKYSFAENLEVKLSDKFFSWGWKSENNKIKNLFSIKLIGKEKFKKINSKKILFVGSCPLVYKSGNTTGTTYGEKSKIYLNHVVSSLENLSILKHDIYFRPFPTFNYNKKLRFLDLENYVRKNFKFINISNPKKNFYDCLNEFGLTIHTRDGTSFFETIALNKPTILIMPKQLIHHRKTALNHFNCLRSAKIFHENPKSLVKFLNTTELNKWWYDKKTQLTIKKFCKEYCNFVKNPIREFDNKVF